MTDLRTARLSLHPVDVAEAERILARQAEPGDVWADDYPFDGDILAVTMFLLVAADVEPRPFGYYRIDRLADGRAVGGVGFKGRPVDGAVEIGYGLAPSARGHGYAAEAVGALLNLAAEHDVHTVRADTELANVASQRTLTNTGFALVRTDAELQYYEIAELRT